MENLVEGDINKLGRMTRFTSEELELSLEEQKRIINMIEKKTGKIIEDASYNLIVAGYLNVETK